MKTKKTPPGILEIINLLIIYFQLLLFTTSCRSVNHQPENSLVQYDDLTGKYVYTFVEEMPAYKEGHNAFMTEFNKKIHYNFQENEDIQTKLPLQFVIDKKGRLTGGRIYEKHVDELTGFEKEGLRVLGLMQDWEPGKHNGKRVNVIHKTTMHIHITYK